MPIIFIATLVFIAIASVLLFLIYVAMPRKTVIEERIESMTPYTDDILVDRPPTRWQIFLGRLGANVPLRPEDLGKYQRQFIAAGMKHQRVPIFMGVKVLLAIALLFFGIGIRRFRYD